MNAWVTRTSPATYPAIVRHSGLSLIQPETGDAPGNRETRNQQPQQQLQLIVLLKQYE